jgi:hypothetical protein
VKQIPHTRRKLREAEYFLRRVRRLGRSPGSVREDFWFELSAFLSAARSVTFVLQSEAKDAYDAWFEPWRAGLSDQQRELLTHLNSQRVSEVHRTGATMTSEVRYFAANELVQDGSRHPAHAGFFAAPPGVSEPKIGIAEHLFTFGDTTTSVVETCTSCFTLLCRGIEEFNQRNTSA